MIVSLTLNKKDETVEIHNHLGERIFFSDVKS